MKKHGNCIEYDKPPGKNPILKEHQTANPLVINNLFADFLGKKIECCTKDEISYIGILKRATKNYIVLHNVSKIKTASREIILKEISKVLIFLEYIITIH